MSNLRARAKEIKAKGVAERGNFTPHGVPLRMYKFWASHAERVPYRENFCHYWRVVAVWAPLMYFRVLFKKINNKTNDFLGLGLLDLWLLVSGYAVGGLLGALILGVGVPYLVTGIFAGLGLADKIISGKWWKLIAIATFPTSALAYGLYKLIVAIDDAWTDTWTKVVKTAGLVLLLGVGLGITVFGLTMAVIEGGWMSLLIGAGAVVGGAVFVAAVFWIVSHLLDFIVGHAQEKAEKRLEALQQSIDDGTYEPIVYKPSRVGKFFTGIVDFLVLIGQVVRVKKWKFCPTVTIEENK